MLPFGAVQVGQIKISKWAKLEYRTQHELEVFKDDGSSIQNPPAARDLVLFTPYGEAGVKWGTGEPEAAES